MKTLRMFSHELEHSVANLPVGKAGRRAHTSSDNGRVKRPDDVAKANTVAGVGCLRQAQLEYLLGGDFLRIAVADD